MIKIAIIGCGQIALANHLPGLALCPEAKVTALCDSNPEVLARARKDLGVDIASTDFKHIVTGDDVDAVIIATPNYTHAEIAVAAAKAGKHILCEKPLALTMGDTWRMYDAARKAKVRHMTAFTYRFVPAMRFMTHLVKQGAVGRPYHFRSCRLQDWGTRALGWRQIEKYAGTGELSDMLSHRIDYAQMLIGYFERVVADMRKFHETRGNQPSELEDWVGVLAEMEQGATGLLESSKVATGHGEGARSEDYCEVNGSEGSLLFQLSTPLQLQIGKLGEPGFKTVAVPDEFLKWPGSPRDPGAGDPLITFRYDQDVEFIQAILEGRDCIPSFREGLQVQAVMDSIQISVRKRKWTEVVRVAT
jgi:predicted dehydrogenase